VDLKSAASTKYLEKLQTKHRYYLQQVGGDYQKADKLLAEHMKVSTKDAQCSSEEDKTWITEQVEADGGFVRLDLLIVDKRMGFVRDFLGMQDHSTARVSITRGSTEVVPPTSRGHPAGFALGSKVEIVEKPGFEGSSAVVKGFNNGRVQVELMNTEQPLALQPKNLRLVEQTWVCPDCTQLNPTRVNTCSICQHELASDHEVTLTKDAVVVGAVIQDLDRITEEVNTTIPARLDAMDEQLGLKSVGSYLHRLEQLETQVLGGKQTGAMTSRLAAIEAIL
jgi:hypothetical protein